MSRTPQELIVSAQQHLRLLHEHLTRGDMDDATIFDAVCMRLSAAIESLGAIDDALRDQAFGSSWPAIWSVRNRIAHGYVIIDRQIIVSTVDHDLPEFEEKIEYLSRFVSGQGGDA